MTILRFEGDFAYIDVALETAGGTPAGVQENKASAYLDIADALGGSIAFTGDFQPETETGTVSRLKIGVHDYRAMEDVLNATFSELSLPFADLFVIREDNFDYIKDGWQADLGVGDFLVRGADASDDILGPGTFITFAGNDIMHAGSGNDQFNAGAGDDRVLGEAGDDILLGGQGNDILLGGAGRDILKGHAGHDRLSGQAGRDTLVGGAGNDVFVFSGQGRDVVRDFGDGNDRIEITAAEDFSDLQITATDRGALVGFGDAEFLLLGVDAGDLTAGDFIF